MHLKNRTHRERVDERVKGERAAGMMTTTGTPVAAAAAVGSGGQPLTFG